MAKEKAAPLIQGKTSDGQLFFRESEFNGYPTFEVSNNAAFNNERRGEDKTISFGLRKCQMLDHPQVAKARAEFIALHSGAKKASTAKLRVLRGGARK